MQVKDIELGGTVHIEHQPAERVSDQTFRDAWGKNVPEGQVPFVVTRPNGKLGWYTLPGDVEVHRDGNVDDLARRN